MDDARLVALAKALASTPSVSGSEGAAIQLISGAMVAAGMEVEIDRAAMRSVGLGAVNEAHRVY